MDGVTGKAPACAALFTSALLSLVCVCWVLMAVPARALAQDYEVPVPEGILPPLIEADPKLKAIEAYILHQRKGVALEPGKH